VADVSTGEPVTPRTRFSAGSMTKSMVATVIAQLAAGGRLSFDDPIAAHVPELQRAAWAERATLRDLLANRSGLPLTAQLEFGFADRTERDDGALARLVADIPPDSSSAGFWSYTNVGWCVLGRVIETASHSSWEVAMRSHLAHAGMGETSFGIEPVGGPRASGHDVGGRRPVPVEPLAARAYGPAGATATSSVLDLLRFAALHLEDPALADLRVVHAEHSIHAWLDSWCLGWASFDWDGVQAWGWDSVTPGERSALRILPQHRAAVVLTTNSSTGRAMARSVFAELMPSAFGITVPPLRLEAAPGAAGDHSRFAGVYAWPDRRVEVTANVTGLVIESEDGKAEALPLDERTFVVDAADPDNPTVTFGAFDDVGRPRMLYVMLWGLPRLAREAANERAE
jgi:CubicO group peptidase (beta-lactamase class C family)